MAILGLLFRRQFGEGFLNLREKEKRIVPKTIHAARRVQDYAIGFPFKHSQGLPISRGSNHAHKSPGASLRRNISEFSDQSRVVSFIIGVVLHKMGSVG